MTELINLTGFGCTKGFSHMEKFKEHIFLKACYLKSVLQHVGPQAVGRVRYATSRSFIYLCIYLFIYLFEKPKYKIRANKVAHGICKMAK